MEDKKEVILPKKLEATEAKLKELKNRGSVKCRHCGKPLDLNDVKMLRADRAQVSCKSCGANNFLARSRPTKAVKSTNKVRMSKKDRKRARAIENGWNN